MHFKRLPIRCRKCVYFILLALTMLPIFFLPLVSRHSHQIYNSPQVKDGVLDLAGYDFQRRKELPLDGEWEFYWHKWLITDNLPACEPDMMIDVPCHWNSYSLNGSRLPQAGYASYRIILKNSPLDSRLLAVVPNLAASYRVFIDGEMVAASGTMSKEPGAGDVTLALAYEWLGERNYAEQELIIEVSGAHNGGLYLAPMMMQDWNGYMASRMRYVMATMALGILLVTILGYACILFLRDRNFHSVALLVLDLLVMMRILMRDELFCIVKEYLPFINYHMTNAILQMLTLFLPVAFLLCARDLVGINMKRRDVTAIIIFELIASVPVFVFLLMGMLKLQYICWLISMLPYTMVLYRMYRKVKEGAPYSLLVSAGMMLTISSLVLASQYAAGLLYINASLFPAFCFILAVCLQDYMYIRKNIEMQADAVEAANLRVKLQEAEMSLMLSQIKPHFLYNALIAIQVLCTREPETAEEAIIRFAKYLRMNMRSINSSGAIPFSEELEHIRNYVAIEKLRFKERLTMCYEIGEEGFSVPPLTIQPLVENAIKHGVCKKVTGGTVILRTYRQQEYNCVEIVDDGVGFDTHILDQNDTQSYGLKNILFRLKKMMRADVLIESKADKGTRILVRLPIGEYGI